MAQATKQQVVKSSARDAFLHLLATAMLFTLAISLLALLSQFVTRQFLDPVNDYIPGIAEAARGSLAALIIAFPVYLWVVKTIEHDLHEDKDRLHVGIRKWLLYFTLLIASLTIIGDLIALVMGFLNGELTVRFGLKALIVLLVAGTIVTYYSWDLKRTSVERPSNMRVLGWAATGVILLSIAFGFTIAGSPKLARQQQIDERRVGDLQSIQSEVVNVFQHKQALPKSLSELELDTISGFKTPVDPETQTAYEYRTTGTLSFELCASFDTASVSLGEVATPAYRDPFNENWQHGAGRTCFARTIDPELYPAITNTQNEVKPVPLR